MIKDCIMDFRWTPQKDSEDGTGYQVLGCAWIAVTGNNGIASLIEQRLLLTSKM